MLRCACLQVFSNDQQLAFELQGSSFKLVVGTLQVRCMWGLCAISLQHEQEQLS